MIKSPCEALDHILLYIYILIPVQLRGLIELVRIIKK